VTTRRSFLGLSAASLAVLALHADAHAAEGELTPNRLATLAAIADVVNPAVGDFPAARELDIAGKLSELMAHMEPGMAAELGQALDLVGGGFLALIVPARGKRFARLSTPTQAAEWQAWSEGSDLQRSVHKAFNSLCGATYWACPEIWPLVNYPGPPL
jgi:hypothetical protein